MAQLKHIFRGESLTVLLTFPEAYDMARIEKHEIYIGATAFTGVVRGQTIELKITSEQTDVMYGKQEIRLWLDDSVFGVKKPYCGDIIVYNSNAKPANDSTSSVSDIIIPIVISETAITVGDVMYNYVKGDKGDTGKYGETKFVINDNMELEQHTLIGNPLNFSLIDGDLVLTEGGETVNLGTIAIKDTYSYDEQRIGTWVNGKPIYRKVILLPNPDINNNIIIQHNLGIDTYLKIDLVSNNTDERTTSAFPLLNTSLFAFEATSDQNSVTMNNVNTYGVNYYLILEYTKL